MDRRGLRITAYSRATSNERLYGRNGVACPIVAGVNPDADRVVTRGEEIRAFLLLALVMVPVLAVIFVASYGFMVWIWQMFAGPPGPPPP